MALWPWLDSKTRSLLTSSRGPGSTMWMTDQQALKVGFGNKIGVACLSADRCFKAWSGRSTDDCLWNRPACREIGDHRRTYNTTDQEPQFTSILLGPGQSAMNQYMKPLGHKGTSSEGASNLDKTQVHNSGSACTMAWIVQTYNGRV